MVALTYIWPVALGMVAIAGIVTPIGLYDEFSPGDLTQAPFQYVQDVSSMGNESDPRSNLDFSRICGSVTLLPCPGSSSRAIWIDNGTDVTPTYPNGYNTGVPRNLTEIYSSGASAEGSTLSSIFDIHARRHFTTQSKKFNNGSDYLVGSFRQLQSLILNDAVEAFQGLIVDTRSGPSIGFRNHSIPLGLKNGAIWTEDLLFAQPETECVNTNLTLDFTSVLGGLKGKDTVLTDLGGFANMSDQYPSFNAANPQSSPELRLRAYQAAWLHNLYTKFYLSLSHPSLNTSSNATLPVGNSYSFKCSSNGPFNFLQTGPFGNALSPTRNTLKESYRELADGKMMKEVDGPLWEGISERDLPNRFASIGKHTTLPSASRTSAERKFSQQLHGWRRTGCR